MDLQKSASASALQAVAVIFGGPLSSIDDSCNSNSNSNVGFNVKADCFCSTGVARAIVLSWSEAEGSRREDLDLAGTDMWKEKSGVEVEVRLVRGLHTGSRTIPQPTEAKRILTE